MTRLRVWGRSRGPSPFPTWAAQAGRALGGVFVVLVFVPPLLLLAAGSLHRPGPSFLTPTPSLVPDPLSTQAYADAFALGGLARATVNSLLVAVFAVPLSVLVASLAGFALARLRGRIVGAVVVVTLLALMVPTTALVVPRFALFRSLQLTDTLVPLVAPALIATSPLYVLVYLLAFRALPAQLYDACRIEDLTPLRTWWRVGLPLVRPVTAAVVVLSFVVTWSNLLDPLVYLYDRSLYTLPLALRSLSTLDKHDFPILLAGAVVATVPALMVFAVAQRWFLHVHEGGSR